MAFVDQLQNICAKTINFTDVISNKTATATAEKGKINQSGDKQNEDEYVEIYDTDFDSEINKEDLQNNFTSVSSSEAMDAVLEAINTVSSTLECAHIDFDINGEIGDFEQGQVDDCWLLTSLNSLSYSEKGREILKDAIKENKDGSYTVIFKGLNFSCTITKEELKDARRTNEYSTGDDDVLLLELAFEKTLDKVKNNEIELPENCPDLIDPDDEGRSIEGGRLEDAIFLLTGENTTKVKNVFYGEEEMADAPEAFRLYNFAMEKFYKKMRENPEKYCAYISFRGEKGNEGAVTIKDTDGNDVVLTHNDGGHAWSLKSIDGNYITMVNPWDTSIEVTVTKQEFEKYAKRIEYYEYQDDEWFKNYIEKLYQV